VTAPSAPRARDTRLWWASAAFFALVAYVPALLTASDVVAADTKQYLYTDPGRLVAGAASLWDPSQFGGGVTHQNIGYLWPLGPYYWFTDAVGVPTWVAQRIWIGSLLFAAAMGVLVLARLLRLSWGGALVAATAYGLSPYLLSYVNRTSILLAPWAGLGWMVALAILAARRGGWRWPALFALVVATVGGINATALVLCGLAPALWLTHAAWVSREVPVRRVLAAAGRIGLLTVAASAWWIVGLVVEARYGSDVLAYSETIQAVSSTSLPSEIVRGLGYWLFYGGDVTGRWNSASTPYLQNPLLIGLGFALAGLAVLALVVLQWCERLWLCALVVVGLVIAVSAYPFDDPSPYGQLIKGASGSTLVLALRSSTRVLPLVLLAFTLATGALLSALRLHVPTASAVGAVAVVGLVALNLPALWNGTYVDALLRRPSTIPAYWYQAATAVTAGGNATRALELPGAEFAAYRWGTTTDALLPGLTTRPTLTRDLLPLGSPGMMDTFNALDDRFQDGTVEPAAIAPVARLLGAGAIVFRGDSAFERYRTARPEQTWQIYGSGATPGLGTPQTFGTPTVNTPDVPMVDEAALSDPAIGKPVPPVAVLPVIDPAPIVRAGAASHVTVLDGSGDGIVDAAAAGLLADPGTLLQSATFTDPAKLAAAVPSGAPLIVTDTNRKRAQQWRSSQDTTGFTEDQGQGVLDKDYADNRLPVFPGTGTDAQTLALQVGGARAEASAYGEPTAYRPEDRADQAIDGNDTTAWIVGDRGEVIGQRLRLTFPKPIALDHLTVVQPHDRPYNRWITRLRITTSSGSTEVNLGESSRRAEGQRVDVPATTTGFVELEIVGTNTGKLVNYFGIDGVGFAEVRIDGATPVTEVVRPPTDLLDALGAGSADHPLTYVLTRERVAETNRWRDDPEATIVRRITVPTARTFTLSGTARVSTRLGDGVALPALLAKAPDAVTNSMLAGCVTCGGHWAVDGDPSTAWQTAFGDPVGASVTVHPGRAIAVDHLDLQITNDADHSVPAALTVAAGGVAERVPLPHVADQAAPAHVSVSFPAVRGDALTVTIAGVDARYTVDRRYGDRVELPVSIAELGIPGYTAPALPATFSTTTHVSVDGHDVVARVSGSTADALAGKAFDFSVAGVALGAGDHEVRTDRSAIAVDRVVLSSPAPAPAVAPSANPVVRVTKNGRTDRTVSVTGVNGPFWLVLGEGLNRGWHASADGHGLGPPTMVDGGSNGWLVTPPAGAGNTLTIHLWWAPQDTVDKGLIVSIIGVVACLVLVLIGGRRERLLGVPMQEPAAANPLIGAGARLSWTRAVGVGVGVAVVAGFVMQPAYGIAVGLAALASARWRRARAILTVGAVGCAALTGLLYVARQVIARPLPGFGWVTRFEFAAPFAFVAILLAVADAVVERLRPGGTAVLGTEVALYEPDPFPEAERDPA
jgi:arabinofuranan 3-O-arabinosyltransferase